MSHLYRCLASPYLVFKRLHYTTIFRKKQGNARFTVAIIFRKEYDRGMKSAEDFKENKDQLSPKERLLKSFGLSADASDEVILHALESEENEINLEIGSQHGEDVRKEMLYEEKFERETKIAALNKLIKLFEKDETVNKERLAEAYKELLRDAETLQIPPHEEEKSSEENS
jgi:hypothetical protein